MKLKLEKKEFDFISSACFIPKAIQIEIINGVYARHSGKKGTEIVKLEILNSSADLIRNLCIDELDQAGFDGEYNLNNRGEILNILIDKFFIGTD